jgi:hypothetical protein
MQVHLPVPPPGYPSCHAAAQPARAAVDGHVAQITVVGTAGGCDLARLLARVAGSLEVLKLPTLALAALARQARRQQQRQHQRQQGAQQQQQEQHQQQQQGGGAPGLALAAQLTRLWRLDLEVLVERNRLDWRQEDAEGWACVLALPALRDLRMDGRAVELGAVDLADLGALASRLEALDIIQCEVASTAGLGACTALRTLRLEHCWGPGPAAATDVVWLTTEQLAPLAGCALLAELDISHYNATSLRPLAGLIPSLTGGHDALWPALLLLSLALPGGRHGGAGGGIVSLAPPAAPACGPCRTAPLVCPASHLHLLFCACVVVRSH